MFTDIKPMKSLAFTAIKNIGFDIIAVMNSGKKVFNYYQETVNNVELGIELVKNQFKDLCQNFIDLTHDVSQQYLN